MRGRNSIHRILRACAAEIPAVERTRARARRRSFEASGRKPWSPGYVAYRDDYVSAALADGDLLRAFHDATPLPDGYGIGLDERCIELPWLFAQLGCESGRLLDAGSTLNHSHLVQRPELQIRELHVLTLAPEATAFWRDGISYLYADLREIPIRDAYYDDVASISTLEHIGHDNAVYVAGRKSFEAGEGDHLDAARELARVLKPGGRLLVTVPFGKGHDYGTFRVFDSTSLAQLVDVVPGTVESRSFYRYSRNGWQIADEAACAESAYAAEVARAGAEGRPPDPERLDDDRAAAARAVACVEFRKS